METQLTDDVLSAAAVAGWPEIPAQSLTGHCWLSAGESAWRRAVKGTGSSVLREWLRALAVLYPPTIPH